MTIYCTIIATLNVVSMLMYFLCMDASQDFEAVGHVGIAGVILCLFAWLLLAVYCAGMNNLLCW